MEQMGLKDWMMKRTIRKMSKEEKLKMMDKMMDEFFASMTAEEKKEMMEKMMPKMMDKMFEGMSGEDKQKLMASMMPKMMSLMMPAMKEMMGWEREPKAKGIRMMPMPKGFKPWKMCPMREVCKREFRKKAVRKRRR